MMAKGMEFEGGRSAAMRRTSHLTSHLTGEQMEAMLRESPYRKQAGKHLESCEACREEVANLAKVLGLFRASSEVYAEKRQASAGPVRGVDGGRAMVPWRWSIAVGALACGLVTAPVVHRMTLHAGSAGVVGDPAPARAVEMSDEALLEGVQEDLASSVPGPLRMLAAGSGMEEAGGAVEKARARATADSLRE